MLYDKAKTSKYYISKIKEILQHSESRLSYGEQLEVRAYMQQYLTTDLFTYYKRGKQNDKEIKDTGKT